MKNCIFYIILMLFLQGCGVDGEFTDVNRDKYYEVDPNLAHYVETFVSNWEEYTGQSHYVNDLTVIFKDEDYFGKLKDGDKILGNCLLNPEFFPPLVRIRWVTWEDMGEVKRQNLINHELGHCLLVRDHNDKMISCRIEEKDQDCSASIMNSHLINSKVYLSDEDYYLNELYSITGDWVQ